jgi:dolichol kinase
MANLDAGLFFVMLFIGILSLILSVKFGALFKAVGAIVFFVLAVAMMANYDVKFDTNTYDGTTWINSTQYIIGDGRSETDDNNSWLGWIFLIIGILLALLFLIELLSGGM